MIKKIALLAVLAAVFAIGMFVGHLGNSSPHAAKSEAPAKSSAEKANAADKFSGEPSVGDRALKVGETRKGKQVDTTVLKVKDNFSDAGLADQDFLSSLGGDRWLAVFARTCAVGTLSQEDAFSTAPSNFALSTSTGSQFNTPESYEANWPSPRFPDATITSGCREGWINYALKSGDKPDRVLGSDGFGGTTFAEWIF